MSHGAYTRSPKAESKLEYGGPGKNCGKKKKKDKDDKGKPQTNSGKRRGKK